MMRLRYNMHVSESYALSAPIVTYDDLIEEHHQALLGDTGGDLPPLVSPSSSSPRRGE
jgi:hypothetical protein